MSTKLSLLAQFDEKIQQSILDASNPTKKGIEERAAARAKAKAFKEQNRFSNIDSEGVYHGGCTEMPPDHNNGMTKPPSQQASISKKA